jgi:hypothetical protein
MKARNIFAGLFVAAAAVPALAAGSFGTPSDEGLPPSLAQQWKPDQMAMKQGPAERYVPQYIFSPNGEGTLTQNPAFMAPDVPRTSAEVIRTQSAPATRYVGA